MCPAGKVCYLFLFSVFLVNGVAIGLEISFEVSKHRYSGDASAGGIVIKQHGSVQRSMVDPIIALMGSTFFVAIQYLYRCFVNLQVAFGFGVEDELFI